jgi:hypothetical protein
MENRSASSSAISEESSSPMFSDTMAARRGAVKSPYTFTPGRARTPS